MGVLRWVEYITTPKYLEKQIEGTPLSLALIDEIAICHPQLHNDVMKLLTKLLENNFPAMDTLILLNLKKNVLGNGLKVARGPKKPSKSYALTIEHTVCYIHQTFFRSNGTFDITWLCYSDIKIYIQYK